MKRITLLKTKHWILSVTASMFIVLALSCQKNDQFLNQDAVAKSSRVEVANSAPETPRADDFHVIQGTLYFKDSDAFVRVHKFITTLSHDERLKFAQTVGFKSLLTYQDEFVKACDAAQDETAFKAILAKYADVASLDASQTLTFKVQSPLLASYQDRTGVLYIGRTLYKFGDREQTIVQNLKPLSHLSLSIFRTLWVQGQCKEEGDRRLVNISIGKL